MFFLPHLRIIYLSIAMANGLLLLLTRLLIVIQLLTNILKALLRIYLIQRMRYIQRTRHIASQKLHSCYRILKSQFLENIRTVACGRLVEQSTLFLRVARRLRLAQLTKMQQFNRGGIYGRIKL
jgi:hypothetical protein